MTLLPPVSFPHGATHTAELQYLFTHLTQKPVLTTQQNELASSMRLYWAQFANSGRPNVLFDAAPRWPAFSLLTNAIQGFVAPTPALRPNFAGDHHCSFWRSMLAQGPVASALSDAN